MAYKLRNLQLRPFFDSKSKHVFVACLYSYQFSTTKANTCLWLERTRGAFRRQSQTRGKSKHMIIRVNPCLLCYKHARVCYLPCKSTSSCLLHEYPRLQHVCSRDKHGLTRVCSCLLLPSKSRLSKRTLLFFFYKE